MAEPTRSPRLPRDPDTATLVSDRIRALIDPASARTRQWYDDPNTRDLSRVFAILDPIEYAYSRGMDPQPEALRAELRRARRIVEAHVLHEQEASVVSQEPTDDPVYYTRRPDRTHRYDETHHAQTAIDRARAHGCYVGRDGARVRCGGPVHVVIQPALGAPELYAVPVCVVHLPDWSRRVVAAHSTNDLTDLTPDASTRRQ